VASSGEDGDPFGDDGAAERAGGELRACRTLPTETEVAAGKQQGRLLPFLADDARPLLPLILPPTTAGPSVN
jgi:hypothetical protein